MKTICNNRLRIVFICALSLLLPSIGTAQEQVKNGYANIDWQFNIPLNNGFSDKASGWGMNFEGGYYFTPHIGAGLFFAFHTNNEYIPTQTLNLSPSSQLTSDQQHALYQLPFGAAFRYRFMPAKKFSPYIGVKLGTQYCKITSYYNIYSSSRDKWGFFVSPEIGANIYPRGPRLFGFHLAFYYDYASNQNKLFTYKIDGLHNLGFRVGLAF